MTSDFSTNEPVLSSCAQELFMGIEIGGTKQQIAVGTAGGAILRREDVRLGRQTRAEDILRWISGTAKALMAEYQVSGVGVGFGGPVDPVEGRILCSLQVEGWQGFGLKDWLEKELAKPAVVLNDTAVGGLAELRLGAGLGSRRFFYTNIGTGIGGGLYDEAGFGASSLGYVWVPDWRDKRPGAETRLEFICSGQNIEERLNAPGYVPQGGFLDPRGGRLTCAQLASGAQAGDEFCCGELDRIAETFSIGLADILALASPDRIAVGGGVAKMGEVLFSRLREFTARRAFVADVGQYEILESALLDDAVLSGALLCAAEPEKLRVWGRRARD